MISKHLTKLAPSRWLSGRHTSEETDEEPDETLYEQESLTVADTVEWLVRTAFSVLITLLTPWRWGRRSEMAEEQLLAAVEEEQETPVKPESARPTIGWWLAMRADALFGRLVDSFDFFEWGTHALFHFVGRLITPWRWFRKPEVSTSDAGLDDDSSHDIDALAAITRVDDEGSSFGLFLWRARETFDWALFWLSEWSSTCAELFEWLTHAVFSALATLVMPWTWFRRDPGPGADIDEVTVDEDRRGVANRFERVLHFVAFGFFVLYVISISAATRVAELAIRLFPPWCLWPLYWGLDRVFELAEFSLDWWYTRDFRKLIGALPAVVLLMPLMMYSVFSLRYSDPSKILHYQRGLVDAMKEKEAAKVDLIRAKLAQLGFRHMEEVEFDDAIELAKDNDYDGAYEIMTSLAPVEEPGHLAAHLWICGALLDGLVAEPDPWSLFETHLRHAETLAPANHPLVRRFRVELLLNLGETDAALEDMAAIVHHFPDLHATMAHTYSQRQDLARAKLHAQRAIRHFESTLQEESTSQHEQLTQLGYVRIALSHGLVGDYVHEYKLLKKAQQEYPEDPLIDAAVTQWFTQRLGAIVESSEATRTAGPLLEEIVQGPKSKDLFQHLVAGLVSGQENAKSLVQHLDEKSLLSSYFYRMTGDAFMIRQEYSEAVTYYQHALRLEPTSSFSWNNIAWVRGNVLPLHLEEALDAANRAIELNPDPRFHETRGQILIKLKRWSEATEDLERALSGSIPNSIDAHRSLAVSYRAMGLEEQAEAHRALAESQ